MDVKNETDFAENVHGPGENFTNKNTRMDLFILEICQITTNINHQSIQHCIQFEK